jgi:hypothetical protein
VNALPTARDLWIELETVGKFEPNYDDGFVADVREQLSLPGGDVATALDSAGVTVEALLAAVLHALAPFSGMLNGLYVLLAEHDAKTSDATIRLRYSFGANREEFAFDLDHFREAASTLAAATILEPVVSTGNLWNLSGLLWTSTPDQESERDLPGLVSQWVHTAKQSDTDPRWALPVPRPPLTHVATVDALVERVHRVVSEVARRCTAYGSLDRLSAAAESSAGTEQPATVADWQPRQLFHMENDHFAANTLDRLWRWALELKAVSPDRRAAAAEPLARELGELMDGWEHVPVAGAPRQLLDVLQLPVWQERDALYEAWVLTLIRQAMRHHSFELEVEPDGAISFRKRETTLARGHSADGPLEVRGELKTQIEFVPATRDRKEHIQPDYAIIATDSGSVPLVVEVKQYVKSRRAGWAHIVDDYARGHEHAHVALVAYNNISPTLLDAVQADVRGRCAAFGSVHPGEVAVLAAVVTDLESALPAAPVPPAPTGPAPAGVTIETIAVDVSGSMSDVLETRHVQAELDRLERAYPDALWIGVDDARRTDPEVDDGTRAEVLRLRRKHGTDLVAALHGLDLARTIVVTDQEGADSIRGRGLAAVGLADSTDINWLT